MTVHEIQDDGTIKEIHKVTGGPHGGIYVNERFESLLDELFSPQKLQRYRKQFPSDWLCLMNEFEAKKRGKRILECSLMTNIRLPRSFVTLVNQIRSPAMERYGEKEVKLKNNEYLSLSSGMMRKLFSPVVESIKKHLKTLLKQPRLSKVRTMLLVGGFAEAAFLQEEIKKEFSARCKVLIPRHATVAVVQGAVMFGKKPTKITQRVVSTTYGISCGSGFIEGVHPEEKKVIVDGTALCLDLFRFFVKENESVELGKRITKVYHPLVASSKELAIRFYVATNSEAQFITDPGVSQIGSVLVKSPDTWKGNDREIEVTMFFGRTEITASGRDVSSGNTVQITLDFFCH